MLTTVVIGLPVTPTHSPLRTLSERVHLGQHLVHLGNDIGPVDGPAGSLGRTQRRVQHRSILGDVDVFACEHGIARPHQPTDSKINKGAQDVGVDQVLG